MKKINLSLVAVVLLIFIFTPAFAGIPSSKKSAKIIQKIEKKLKKSLHRRGFEYGSPVFIRVFKASKSLEMWIKKDEQYKLFRKYRICRHSGGLGPKQRYGDKQSPEGFYTVTADHLNPFSSYHLSINVGYPNMLDRAYHRTGSGIMIHGRCGSRGCFAMTDRKIEEIYTLVHAALSNGQHSVPVHIYPFKMSDSKMKKYRKSRWAYFWFNLKEGYDYFEENKIPPKILVIGRRYAILKYYRSFFR